MAFASVAAVTSLVAEGVPQTARRSFLPTDAMKAQCVSAIAWMAGSDETGVIHCASTDCRAVKPSLQSELLTVPSEPPDRKVKATATGTAPTAATRVAVT